MKPSKYNIIFEHHNDTYAFNTKNCCLVRVNEEFLSLTREPNNVKDIEYKKLQKQMYEAGFLVDDNIDELAILEYQHNVAKFNSKKLTITILPTLSCNFNCFYCFEDETNVHIGAREVEAIQEFVKERINGIEELNICWFGGEPLIKQDTIWQLSKFFIELTNNKNIKYSAVMISNGYLINNEIIAKLIENKICRIQITIDGPEYIHNNRRCLKNGEGTFEVLIKNIKLLTKENIDVMCRVNIDRTNINSIKELLNYLGSLCLPNFTISFGQVLQLGSNDKWSKEICLSRNEFSKIVDELSLIAKANKLVLPMDYPFYPRPSYNFCGASQTNSYVIHPNGDLHKCYDCLDYKIGDIFTGIGNTDLEKQNLAYWSNISPFKDEECRECNVLPICMGSCPYLNKKMNSKFCLKWKEDIIFSLINQIQRQM